ncbi:MULTISPECIES: spermidine/putrescine ABC transporter substrate-binding protein [unclassified Moorena]|uniref:ABC transporter substrate-binding protein n=1 Tax=unclassified Moorena TaxID=2683338 RepID=UPI0013CBA7C5|nr:MULTISPECIES: spermidine/putrescine ABC transporter substrate-binding protein [unclassified Moorena]NEO22145.1 spermidine/putrescine ABC transporter substrate-binding protein [Moorena sp. SIO4A5]NEQ60152.1 spermidine/putrescine ABC transporter substrate-binding protein [Moorena sp. SIO4A1]
MLSKDRQSLLKRPTRRNFLQLATVATLSGLTLSGCGWTLAEVRPTPPSPGDRNKLFIYTWTNYTDDELLDRFKEITGIKAVVDVFDSNEAMLARLQASGGGAYSIIYPSDYMVRKMVELDLLVKLDFERIIGINRLFSKFLNPIYDPNNLHSIPLSWGTTGLIYNSKKLSKVPEDWSYLWQYKDKLSRRMTLLNDVREVMGATLKMLGYSYNSTNPQEIKKAYETLVELKPSIASFSSDAWRSQILSGDLWLAMCYSSDAVEIMAENPDLQYVLPKSGSSLWTDTLAIPKTAPNLEGAYAWINFMLEADVAAQICERLSFATPNQKAFKLLSRDIQEDQSLFPEQSALERCEGLAPVDEVSELYDRYWTQLTSA